jgi:hypothetical protein
MADDITAIVNSMLNNAEVYQTMELHVEALDAYEQIIASHTALDDETKKTVEDNITLLKQILDIQDNQKDPQAAKKEDKVKYPRAAKEEDKVIEPLSEDLSDFKESLFRSGTAFDDADIAPILDDAAELMATKAEVKKYIREAKLYQDQDLLSESHDKYMAALKLLESNDAIKGKQNLVAIIKSKLKSLDIYDQDEAGIYDELDEAEKLLLGLNEGAEELVLGVQAKKDKDTEPPNPLEAAVALMNDSQFEEALIRLRALMDDEAYRVEAAGKLLECQTAIESAGKAVDQLEAWLAEDLFKPEQSDIIRDVLSKILESKGIIKITTRVVAAQPVGQQRPPASNDSEAYGIPAAPYYSGEAGPDEAGLDDKEFEFTDDEYSDIIDTIDIKAPLETDLEENSDGDYIEFDFIDNIDNTNETLPAYINGNEKENYEEFDVVDSAK